ncbi:3-deoxy-7-phosphoheptulonate synthase [Lautropia mirabilis]
MSAAAGGISSWSPESWRTHPARQMPTYPDQGRLDAVCGQLRAFPPLIFAGEVQALRAQLAEVAAGRAFLLQGGTVPRASTCWMAMRRARPSGCCCRCRWC